MTTCVDIFPAVVSRFVQVLPLLESKKDFNVRRQAFVPFLTFLRKGKIYFREKEWGRKNTAHFFKLGPDSAISLTDRPRAPLWDMAQKRLLKADVQQENTDVRLCFRFRNLFLVKNYFTFGLRTVQPGTRHIYQTSAAPLFLYNLLDDDAFPEKSFNTMHQFKYSSHRLEPSTVYGLPEGTRYMIMAVQKTLFSVDVVPDTMPLLKGCVNPLVKEKSKKPVKRPAERDPYSMAPPTPQMDYYWESDETFKHPNPPKYNRPKPPPPLFTPDAVISSRKRPAPMVTPSKSQRLTASEPQLLTPSEPPQLLTPTEPQLLTTSEPQLLTPSEPQLLTPSEPPQPFTTSEPPQLLTPSEPPQPFTPTEPPQHVPETSQNTQDAFEAMFQDVAEYMSQPIQSLIDLDLMLQASNLESVPLETHVPSPTPESVPPVSIDAHVPSPTHAYLNSPAPAHMHYKILRQYSQLYVEEFKKSNMYGRVPQTEQYLQILQQNPPKLMEVEPLVDPVPEPANLCVRHYTPLNMPMF